MASKWKRSQVFEEIPNKSVSGCGRVDRITKDLIYVNGENGSRVLFFWEGLKEHNGQNPRPGQRVVYEGFASERVKKYKCDYEANFMEHKPEQSEMKQEKRWKERPDSDSKPKKTAPSSPKPKSINVTTLRKEQNTDKLPNSPVRPPGPPNHPKESSGDGDEVKSDSESSTMPEDGDDESESDDDQDEGDKSPKYRNRDFTGKYSIKSKDSVRSTQKRVIPTTYLSSLTMTKKDTGKETREDQVSPKSSKKRSVSPSNGRSFPRKKERRSSTSSRDSSRNDRYPSRRETSPKRHHSGERLRSVVTSNSNPDDVNQKNQNGFGELWYAGPRCSLIRDFRTGEEIFLYNLACIGFQPYTNAIVSYRAFHDYKYIKKHSLKTEWEASEVRLAEEEANCIPSSSMRRREPPHRYRTVKRSRK